MNGRRDNKVLLGSGILLAITSSLCCIVPLLAIVGSTGSAVAAFSWAAPLRPYLLGATVIILMIAFYRAYKPRKKDACGCEEKKGVMQSKTFLWIITIISGLLLTFPYYAKYLQQRTPQKLVTTNSNTQQVVLRISGMSCEACEDHVNNALSKMKGVQYVNTSYAKGETTVRFDSTAISLQQLANTIVNETGYKIIP